MNRRIPLLLLFFITRAFLSASQPMTLKGLDSLSVKINERQQRGEKPVLQLKEYLEADSVAQRPAQLHYYSKMLIEALMELQQWEEAIEYGEKAIQGLLNGQHYDPASDLLTQLLQIKLKTGNFRLAYRLNMLASGVYRRQGHELEALEIVRANYQYLPSLSIEEKKRFYRALAQVYYASVGLVNMLEPADRDSLLSYYNKSIQLAEESRDSVSIVNSKLAIASVYSSASEMDRAIEILDEVLLETEGKSQHFRAVMQKASILLRIKPKQAIDMFMEGMEYVEANMEGRELHYQRAAICSKLSRAFFWLKDYRNSIKWSKASIVDFEQMHAHSQILQHIQSIQICYAALEEYSKALEYADEFINRREKIYQAETRVKVADANKDIRYQMQQQELELLQAKSENQGLKIEQQTNQAYLLVAIVLALMAGVAFFRTRYLSKQRKSELLQEKNEEIQAQNNLLAEQQASLSDAYQKITDSVRYAERIQYALVGQKMLWKQLFPDTFLMFKPKDIVSGDFCWYAEVGGLSVFIVADCTGHGVPGAFMTVLGNSLLNGIIRTNKVTDPADILRMLDGGLHDSLQDEKINDGMDMSVAVYNRATRELQFAGAKNPLWLWRQEQAELEVVKGSRFPIGSYQYMQEKVFEGVSISLSPNDAFYLFSDGYQDQFGGNAEKKRKFMKKRFRELVKEIASLSMEDQQDRLQQELESWQGSEKQTDDICVLGVRVP